MPVALQVDSSCTRAPHSLARGHGSPTLLLLGHRNHLLETLRPLPAHLSPAGPHSGRLPAVHTLVYKATEAVQRYPLPSTFTAVTQELCQHPSWGPWPGGGLPPGSSPLVRQPCSWGFRFWGNAGTKTVAWATPSDLPLASLRFCSFL